MTPADLRMEDCCSNYIVPNMEKYRKMCLDKNINKMYQVVSSVRICENLYAYQE